jgi:hypothetical protein
LQQLRAYNGLIANDPKLQLQNSTSRSAARLPPRNPWKRKLAAAYAGPKPWPAKEIVVHRKEVAIF